MATWKIIKHDSDNEPTVIGRLPGNMSEAEVAEILKRLVSHHLSEEEIVLSSLRRGQKYRRTFLDPIPGNKLCYGENPWFVGERSK